MAVHCRDPDSAGQARDRVHPALPENGSLSPSHVPVPAQLLRIRGSSHSEVWSLRGDRARHPPNRAVQSVHIRGIRSATLSSHASIDRRFRHTVCCPAGAFGRRPGTRLRVLRSRSRHRRRPALPASPPAAVHDVSTGRRERRRSSRTERTVVDELPRTT